MTTADAAMRTPDLAPNVATRASLARATATRDGARV